MNIISFGNYWKTGYKKKEPIEWIVLREDDDKMYIISRFCLDCVPYCDGHQLAWKNSIMREWLNGYFLDVAFTPKEQSRIILSEIKTSGEIHFLDKGTATQDKVFLPSLAEAHIYFGQAGLYNLSLHKKRIARPTDYAVVRGCWASSLKYSPVKNSVLRDSLLRDAELTGGAVNPNVPVWQVTEEIIKEYGTIGKDTAKKRYAACWFLRTPGSELVYVDYDGSVGYMDKNYISSFEQHIAIRPAMWISK